MKLNYLAKQDVGWLKSKDSEDVGVMSTRIRLARNLKNYPFPRVANPDDLKKCMDDIFSACEKSSFFKNAIKLKLDECSDIDRRLLLERHHISHEHAVSSSNGGVIIDSREQISIMINEEDHLRIQYISGGLGLFESWDIINSLDDELSRYLSFAYSEKWGYLTSCPTNTGTGMRASCQMHLPGLGMTRALKKTMENINKMGMVVRGLYGEGTRVIGNVLQISNQVTLGISEQRIIDNLKRLVVQVLEREKKVQQNILQSDKDKVLDNVYRSVGLLSNAFKISFIEALELISNVKFGISVGLLDIDINKINNLMIKIQPAHIQELENNSIKSSERDIIRAKYIKRIIKQ